MNFERVVIFSNEIYERVSGGGPKKIGINLNNTLNVYVPSSQINNQNQKETILSLFFIVCGQSLTLSSKINCLAFRGVDGVNVPGLY